ncbi:MAG: sulfite exporter TauE/SafE family protein, partial [Pseudomonadota bacterium]
MAIVYLIPLFFLTALVYSSVGFAGGSTYLALLLLFQFPYTAIPKVALVCNLIVGAGALYHYIRGRHLSFGRVIPFVAASVPCAYLGGSLPIGKELFMALAAVSLAAAGLRLLFIEKITEPVTPAGPFTVWSVGLGAGAVFGFLGGLVGIGGGIFLAPLLYLLKWGTPRQIAAMASFFIFANSLSGLAGQFHK